MKPIRISPNFAVWVLAALALLGVVRPLGAQSTQITYTESFQTAPVAQTATGPLGYWESPQAGFAAYNTWLGQQCASQYICTTDSFQVCQNSRYDWDNAESWCWHEKRVVAANGQVVLDATNAGISVWAVCPVGYTFVQKVVSPLLLQPSCQIERSFILPCDKCLGNPILASSGTKFQEEKDYQSGDGLLEFGRQYDSAYKRFRSEYDFAFIPPQQSVGKQLTSGVVAMPDPQTGNTIYLERQFLLLNKNPNISSAVFTDKFGAREEMTWDGSNSLSLSPYFKDRFVAATINGAPGWLFYRPGEQKIVGTDQYGTAQFAQRPDGRRVTLGFVSGQLSAVADDFGHALQVNQGPNGISSVVDPDGKSITYQYTDHNKLSSVTYQDGSVRTYTWDEPALSSSNIAVTDLLTGIVDESATRYASFTYLNGRAVGTQHAGGAEAFSLVDGRNGTGNGSIAFTDALGTARTDTYSVVNGFSVLAQTTQPASSGPGTVSSSQNFDSNNNVSSRVDFNGYAQCFLYDLGRNLEIVRIEGLAAGVGCPANLSAYSPTLGTSQRKFTTQYHPQWNLPSARAEPNRITLWVYNGQPDGSAGGATANCAPGTATLVDGSPIVVLCKLVVEETADGTGAQGLAAAIVSTPRIWTYTYDSYGRVLTADGPRTDVSDVTTYTYYTCTTGGACGQVNTITNAAGQVTTYNTYNAHGQPTQITDPNGVVTTLSYDLRQRLTSRCVNGTLPACTGGEKTAFAYWPTGLLQQVTLPDGSYTYYTYDAAHRLTRINDAAGNYISYTLDAMGNRTAESAYDPGNVLSRTRSRVYNSLNQLSQDIGSAGTAGVTTSYTYDNNGNQTAVNAPLARNSTNQYDELNRLKQITDPASGNTLFGYDANDNLTSVQDPINLTTNYTYSGFGDLKTQVSPQTGTTSNTYDSGGNLFTSTDARNKTATYSYDALNRARQVAYGDQTIAYGYDAGTNGKGRLTSASDANHSMSWGYDALGRVTSKTQVVNGLTRTVGYGYTSGNLTSETTPSGQSIGYAYSNGRIASVTVNGTTLLSAVAYEPYGPVRGWSWGNGTTETRLHDTDGNPSQFSDVESLTYTLDNAFRITGIANNTNTGLGWGYGYDSLDRLTSATQGSTSLGWTFDGVGNRKTQTGALAAAYPSAGITLNYNNRNRLIGITGIPTATTYVYNALGQRVQKSGAGTTYFAYDEAGRLIGEYDNTGALIEETVYLSDLPVATLRPKAGGGVNVYYVHSDHLGSPRRVTQPSNNAVMWRWDSDPYGVLQPNQNPSGLGTFAYNLRFPGQYYDPETALNYNYFRDHDPQTGRYVESDPIGLTGGQNTYSYVFGSPLSHIDSLGLYGYGEVREAWNHYCDGTGTDWSTGFSSINWGDTSARAIAKVAALVGTSCTERTVPVSFTLPTSAVGADSKIIGRHVVSIDGSISVHCDCTWEYSGSMFSALGYDTYDFDASNRGFIGESLTWIGAHRCPEKGKPFNIKLTGQQALSSHGTVPGGTSTCCRK